LGFGKWVEFFVISILTTSVRMLILFFLHGKKKAGMAAGWERGMGKAMGKSAAMGARGH
jgi:preprotein translocase subunit SecG